MKKAFIITMVINMLMLVAAIVLFFHLPERIPVHWNIHGKIDGYAGKGFIFIMPAFSLALTLLFYVLPKITAKGENIEKSGRFYPVVLVLMSLFMVIILVTIALAAFGVSVPASEIILAFTGILMIVIGNYLPKVKPNYIAGIRNSWTLANEDVWKETHRFSGWVFFVIGLLFMGGIFLPAPVNFILPLTGVFIGIFAITVFAYVSYRNHKRSIK